MAAGEVSVIASVLFVLAGVLIRGHAPRLWPFVAPLFGTTPPGFPPVAGALPGQTIAVPPPVVLTTPAGSSGPPHPGDGEAGALASRYPRPRDGGGWEAAWPASIEEELESCLSRYIRRNDRQERIERLLAQATRRGSWPPTPSLN